MNSPSRRGLLTNVLTSDTHVYEDDETEFLIAVQRYKEDNHRPHPSWREVLAIYKSLGYRQVGEKSALPKYHTRGK